VSLVFSLARFRSATCEATLSKQTKSKKRSKKEVTRTQTQKTATMPYVGRDGTVGGRKSTMRMITDFFQGIFDFVGLFFGAITNPPQRIESQATYGQRNNGRSYRGTGSGGSNIRGVKNLGDASARMGG
jgi:hypothetical protein